MAWSDLMGVLDTAVIDRLREDVRAITYTPIGGTAVPLPNAIFGDDYTTLSESRAGIASSGPYLFLRETALPDQPWARQGETLASVTVGTAAYRVHTAERDGQGGVVLLLHKAPA